MKIAKNHIANYKLNLGTHKTYRVLFKMRKYAFEKLESWQLSRKLITDIYLDTQTFPRSELFGITNQLRRAAISIASNISEGSGRKHNKEKAQFYRIAYGSLMEVLNQLIIAKDLKLISSNRLNSYYRPEIEKLSLMIYKLNTNPNPLTP
jgi:four helix bundle protein